MPYLLDTNVVHAIRHRDEKVNARLRAVWDQAFISGIVVEEILSNGYFAKLLPFEAAPTETICQ